MSINLNLYDDSSEQRDEWESGDVEHADETPDIGGSRSLPLHALHASQPTAPLKLILHQDPPLARYGH